MYRLQKELVAGPEDNPLDTISEITWLNQNYLCTVSWDGVFRVYALKVAESLKVQSSRALGQPLLCSCKGSGKYSQQVYVGKADGSIVSINLNSGNCTQVGKHEGPVTMLAHVQSGRLAGTVLSGGVDKRLIWWDPASQKAINMQSTPDKILVGAYRRPYLLGGCSEGNVLFVDTQTGAGLNQQVRSPLGQMSSVISTRISPNLEQAVIGGIDGRVCCFNAIRKYDGARVLQAKSVFNGTKERARTMAGFQLIHPANSLDFQSHGCVLVAGGRRAQLWDTIEKKVTRVFEQDSAVNVVRYSEGGRLALASGYDWEFGLAQAGRHSLRLAVYLS